MDYQDDSEKQPAKGSQGKSYVESSARAAYFSGFLKSRRVGLGMTQRELAERVGVTVTTIQNYESGRLPKGGHLVSLAQALGCSADELLGMGPCEIGRPGKRGRNAQNPAEPSQLMREMEFVESALRRAGASDDEIKRALLDCLARASSPARE